MPIQFTKLPDIPSGYDPNDPWASDKLDRQKLTIPLNSFLSQTPGPFVIAIDSGWGSGKSLFLQMWADDLRHIQGKPCLDFNAWEHDYTDDPLIPFLDELMAFSEQVAAKVGSVHTLIEKLRRKSLSIVKMAPKSLLKITLKYLATKGVDLHEIFSEDNIDDIDKDGLASSLADIGCDLFESYRAKKKSIDDFKRILSQLALEVSNNYDGAPLVIMVDELDRCRPDYAVLLLERIKHLFGVGGIIFVLAIESKQLCCTIKSLYGNELHSGIYLRKFIDLWYTLPQPDAKAFISYLVETNDLSRRFNDEQMDIFIDSTSEIFYKSSLHLRDMSQIFLRLSVVTKSYDLDWINSTIIVFYLVYQLINPDLYKKLSVSPHEYSAMHDIVGASNYLPASSRPAAIFESVFAYMKSGTNGLEKLVQSAREQLRRSATDTAKFSFIITNKETIYSTAPQFAKIIECINLAGSIEISPVGEYPA